MQNRKLCWNTNSDGECITLGTWLNKWKNCKSIEDIKCPLNDDLLLQDHIRIHEEMDKNQERRDYHASKELQKYINQKKYYTGYPSGNTKPGP